MELQTLETTPIILAEISSLKDEIRKVHHELIRLRSSQLAEPVTSHTSSACVSQSEFQQPVENQPEVEIFSTNVDTGIIQRRSTISEEVRSEIRQEVMRELRQEPVQAIQPEIQQQRVPEIQPEIITQTEIAQPKPEMEVKPEPKVEQQIPERPKEPSQSADKSGHLPAHLSIEKVFYAGTRR